MMSEKMERKMIYYDEAAGVFSLRLVGAKISLDFRSRKRREKKVSASSLVACIFVSIIFLFIPQGRSLFGYSAL